MNERSKFLSILSKISIILLVFSIIFFVYNFVNFKNFKLLKEKNVSLKNELQEITKKEQEAKIIYEKKSDSVKDIQKEFMQKYGYDFTMSEKSVIDNAIKYIERENQDIMESTVSLVNKYKNYYDGDYYKSENYDRAVNDFLNLTTIQSTESLSTNLYNDVNITSFMEDAKKSGTIGYLKSINVNSKEVDTMLFLTAVYSNNLNNIASDSSSIKNKTNLLYPEVDTLYNVYTNLETYGLYTGSLNSQNLKEFRDKLYELNKKYNENTGLIEVLKNAGDNNEKTQQ